MWRLVLFDSMGTPMSIPVWLALGDAMILHNLLLCFGDGGVVMSEDVEMTERMDIVSNNDVSL
jgi:hypothetical protein